MQKEMDMTKQKIGIIGGGQLGKMMILEAKKMGFYVIILDPTADCPADSIADEHIIADFDDEGAIMELAEKTHVVTYEFEHINTGVLKALENKGYKIYPTARSLAVIQNKYDQKEVLRKNNIPVPDYMKVLNMEEIDKAGKKFGFPLMLKSCTGGYDGKGNAVIRDRQAIEDAFSSLSIDDRLLMVEEFISFTREISVLACRDIDGNIAVYPVGENEHRDNILYETRVPARISPELASRAKDLASRVMEVFSGIGMFCVEMFVTADKKLLVNEIAPRPHNSGHYSIEGCVTSQFEQHIRAVAGLPLGETTLIRPSVMRNILGTEPEGKAVVTGIEDLLKISGVKVHIYGKGISRPGRKMGHITATAARVERAAEKVLKASEKIRIKGEGRYNR